MNGFPQMHLDFSIFLKNDSSECDSYVSWVIGARVDSAKSTGTPPLKPLAEVVWDTCDPMSFAVQILMHPDLPWRGDKSKNDIGSAFTFAV